MPSKTFFHLPAEKRERLLLAAEEEFARVPYAEASINRMIRAAGIPRGSFYMYFRDKEELFHYLLKRSKAFTPGNVLTISSRRNITRSPIFRLLRVSCTNKRSLQ